MDAIEPSGHDRYCYCNECKIVKDLYRLLDDKKRLTDELNAVTEQIREKTNLYFKTWSKNKEINPN